MRGWKVLSSSSNRVSCIVVGPAEVYYPVNRKAKPKENCGPLTVFTTKRAAIDFAKYIPDTKLVRCIYTKSRESQLYYFCCGDLCEIQLESLPAGTDFASSVTCLE